MTVSLTWKVERIECYPEKEGKQNVVHMVHWRCTGVDGGFSGANYGTQSLIHDADAPFTPYAELAHDEVVGWVKSAIGDERVARIEASVVAQIEEQKSPPSVAPPLPWAGV
jgi:hypothetical protein